MTWLHLLAVLGELADSGVVVQERVKDTGSDATLLADLERGGEQRGGCPRTGSRSREATGLHLLAVLGELADSGVVVPGQGQGHGK